MTYQIGLGISKYVFTLSVLKDSPYKQTLYVTVHTKQSSSLPDILPNLPTYETQNHYNQQRLQLAEKGAYI